MDKNTSVADLLDYACNESANVLQGKEFRVKDLFKGYIWSSLDLKKQKLSLGSAFFNKHKELGLTTANPEKSNKGQQKYIKL
ncbi:MAG: single-stranded DNA-binding protein [Firmicutes bacterium]|nr:single-stranded DNA-binding protein [Bacillota bacterium]